MVKLFNSFKKLQSKKIIVIGDLMLDTYTMGDASRISPEAPVVVLRVHKEEKRAGGAGNAALCLKELNQNVKLIGRIGDDAAGKTLLDLFKEEGFSASGIFTQKNYQTPLKNRVIANNQQIIRVDREDATDLPELLEEKIINDLPTLLENVDLIAISDYGKGFLTKTLLSAIISYAKEKNIPTVIDPKGVDYSKYRGAFLIKPNLKEVYIASNLTPDHSLETAAQKVLETTGSEYLFVTKSDKGISIFSKEMAREDFPVVPRDIVDVTGAGDTVLAILSASIANGLSLNESAHLSNLAAGLAVQRFGCAAVTLSEIANLLLSEGVENKIYDEEHLYALKEALKGKKSALIEINSKNGITIETLNLIRQVKRKNDWQLLIYIDDLDPPQEFLDALASLHDVDYIINYTESAAHLCALLDPDETYLEKEGVL